VTTIFKVLRRKGLTGIFILFRHRLLVRIVDSFIIWIKKYSFTTGNKTILTNLPSHTVKENARIWDSYDWSKGGEEWSNYAKTYMGQDPSSWKASLINEMMLKYIKKDSTILEIGPGAGRWTAILQTLASRLILADISKRCIDICKERFRAHTNIEYNLIKGKLDFIDDSSIDYIWSYDVFVHINPTDVEGYIADFQRILKPGGYSIIHHSGAYNTYLSEKAARVNSFRSCMSANLFAQIVAKHGMKIVEQNDNLVHIPGDIISVFTKPFANQTK
jgi:ubiquinone/menaquinone biosynthesis C-methylase UbiE